jgi:hypothetical protein
MAQATLDTPIGNMTLSELKEFIKNVIREERCGECCLDDDGWLTFYDDEFSEVFVFGSPLCFARS